MFSLFWCFVCFLLRLHVLWAKQIIYMHCVASFEYTGERGESDSCLDPRCVCVETQFCRCVSVSACWTRTEWWLLWSFLCLCSAPSYFCRCSRFCWLYNESDGCRDPPVSLFSSVTSIAVPGSAGCTRIVWCLSWSSLCFCSALSYLCRCGSVGCTKRELRLWSSRCLCSALSYLCRCYRFSTKLPLSLLEVQH